MQILKKQSAALLRWFCDPSCLEDIRGDLEEIYTSHLLEGREKYASLNFTWQVILLFRPAIIKKFNYHFLMVFDMLRNYLIIGFRNLFRNKSTTIIHVFGLGLGLAAFLLINQYTIFERSYDEMHTQDQKLVRLTTDNIVNGQIQVRDAMSFAPSGKVITDEFAEVLNYSTSHKFSPLVIRKGDQIIEEDGVLAVDSNFLELFNYELISGDRRSILNEPFQLLLTESLAIKYFGSTDVIDQSLTIVSRFDRAFKVVGVIQDAPENTHYKFTALMSLSSIKDQTDNDEWNGFNYYTFLELAPGTDMEDLESNLLPTAKKYLGDDTKLFFNLQPVKDIHLYSDYTYEPEVHGNAKAIRLLAIISIFILIIAWVNYINLSTARAVDRAKEVGLRKVVGARRRQLINQFLVEATTINLISALFAMALIWIAAPYFNQFVDKDVLTNVFSNSNLLWKVGLFFVVGILMSGLYPALVLSSFRPVQVVQGKFQNSNTGHTLRRALVIFQFTASLVLIANTIIVYKQVNYMLNKDHGMDISSAISIKNYPVPQEQRAQFASNYRTFLHEISILAGVKAVGSMSSSPGGGSMEIGSRSGGVKLVGLTDVVEGTVYVAQMNDQVVPTLELQLLNGRNFDREIAADTQSIIINESLLKKLNIPDAQSAINANLQFGSDPENPRWKVVGVVKDFSRSTLKNPIEPTILFYSEMNQNNVVKLSRDNPANTLNVLSVAWQKFFPNSPFTYEFLDKRFEKLYLDDQRFGDLFAYFSLLAIIVASLGLFGLSSFLATKRTKEIGIRKVLGASTTHIVLSFFKEYLWLILTATLVGLPIIYFVMQPWLQNYAYHIDFPWWVLAIAPLIICTFAFFTVGFQNLKVAQLNPSEAIRHE